MTYVECHISHFRSAVWRWSPDFCHGLLSPLHPSFFLLDPRRRGKVDCPLPAYAVVQEMFTGETPEQPNVPAGSDTWLEFNSDEGLVSIPSDCTCPESSTLSRKLSENSVLSGIRR